MTNTTCPVCNTPCQQTTTSCQHCHFEDQHGIARPVVTLAEANHRLETVIRPYRRLWENFRKKEEALQAQLNSASNEASNLRLQKGEFEHEIATLKKDKETVKEPTSEVPYSFGPTTGMIRQAIARAQLDKLRGQCNTGD